MSKSILFYLCWNFVCFFSYSHFVYCSFFSVAIFQTDHATAVRLRNRLVFFSARVCVCLCLAIPDVVAFTRWLHDEIVQRFLTRFFPLSLAGLHVWFSFSFTISTLFLFTFRFAFGICFHSALMFTTFVWSLCAVFLPPLPLLLVHNQNVTVRTSYTFRSKRSKEGSNEAKISGFDSTSI